MILWVRWVAQAAGERFGIEDGAVGARGLKCGFGTSTQIGQRWNHFGGDTLCDGPEVNLVGFSGANEKQSFLVLVEGRRCHTKDFLGDGDSGSRGSIRLRDGPGRAPSIRKKAGA